MWMASSGEQPAPLHPCSGTPSLHHRKLALVPGRLQTRHHSQEPMIKMTYMQVESSRLTELL